MKICYAASSGGHLNQIKELFDKVECDSYYVVTDKSQHSKSLLSEKDVTYIQDTKRNLIYIFSNIYMSYKHIKNNKPDVIITTGAGCAFFSTIMGKLFGSKVIVIESFSRINKPSLFGRLTYPLSDLFIVQWKRLQKRYKKSKFVGSIFQGKSKSFKKQKNQVFVTVGASSFPFDRLIRIIDMFAYNNPQYKIISQIGTSKYVPKNHEYFRFDTIDNMQNILGKSEICICHAGTGSIINSLLNNCYTIAIPRLSQYKEIVNDHQLEIAMEFEKLGYLIVNENVKSLLDDINKVKTKTTRYTPENRMHKLINSFTKSMR